MRRLLIVAVLLLCLPGMSEAQSCDGCGIGYRPSSLSSSGGTLTGPIYVPAGASNNTSIRIGDNSGLYGLWVDGQSINIRSRGHIQLAPLSGGVLPVNSAYTIGQAGTRWGAGHFNLVSSLDPSVGATSSERYGLASEAGEEGVAVGNTATADYWRAVAVGYKANAGAISATALGRGARALNTHSIAIGRGAWVDADNAIAIGFSGGNSATDIYFESGHTHKYVDPVDAATITRVPASTPIVIHGFDAYDATVSPTNDVAGGPLYLVGGRGTGTAVGGDVVIQAAPVGGGTSNTKNTAVAVITAEAATGMPKFNVVFAAAPAAGDCDAAGETGRIVWDSTNDNLYICSGASGWRKVAVGAP